MENESLMNMDVPESWYEHDENGNRVSLSFIGCLAVACVGIELAYKMVNYFREADLINK